MDTCNLGGNSHVFGLKRFIRESASTSYATACHENTPNSKFGASHQMKNGTPVTDSSEKNKRVSKIIGGGLRELSVIVCKKLKAKRRTTYIEVADEIVTEIAETCSKTPVSLDESDVKNIRRRVYDALNVLIAIDFVTKHKDIIWKGLPNTDFKGVEEIKELRVRLMDSLEKKATYLKELDEQIAGLQNLMLRNQQLLSSGNAGTNGLSLPLILIQTKQQATVEIEISEDMQLVHIDFNSTPFSLHDDVSILNLMRQYEQPETKHVTQSSVTHSSSSSVTHSSSGTQLFSRNSETHS